MLHDFDPNSYDTTFPCPTTWEFVSKYISGKDKLNQRDKTVISGMISSGTALQFDEYCEIYHKLPGIKELINLGDKFKLSDEASIRFAISTMISHYLSSKNIDKLMKVINKFPIDMQAMILGDACQKDNMLIDSPAVNKWITENSDTLF
jgi:hypothetical protein